MRITETALVTLALMAVANAGVTINAKCTFSRGRAILGYSGHILCTAQGSNGSNSRMEKSWSQLVPRIMSACENVGIVCAEVDWTDEHLITLYLDGEKQVQRDANAKCTYHSGGTTICENSGTFVYQW